MTLFELIPQEAAGWVQSTLQLLPAGSLKPGEAERLMKGISDKVQSGETRKIRALLQGLLLFRFDEPFCTDTASRLHEFLPKAKCCAKRRSW